MNIEYNALLQLCGEKTEEVEELRLDLQDLKEMYKLQVKKIFFFLNKKHVISIFSKFKIEDLLKRTNV